MLTVISCTYTYICCPCCNVRIRTVFQQQKQQQQQQQQNTNNVRGACKVIKL